MMTEKEAREKWCPHARAIAVTGADDPYSAGNRVRLHVSKTEALIFDDDPNPESCRCIASDCAAWRWRRRYADEKRDAKISHVTGYCGLSGKP